MKRRVRTAAATLVLTTGVALMTIALPAMAQNADPLPLRFEDVDTTDHPQVTITIGVPGELSVPRFHQRPSSFPGTAQSSTQAARPSPRTASWWFPCPVEQGA